MGEAQPQIFIITTEESAAQPPNKQASMARRKDASMKFTSSCHLQLGSQPQGYNHTTNTLASHPIQNPSAASHCSASKGLHGHRHASWKANPRELLPLCLCEAAAALRKAGVDHRHHGVSLVSCVHQRTQWPLWLFSPPVHRRTGENYNQ